MAPTPTVIPTDVAWKARAGDTEAHAFSAGPGWMRSVCRRERWTVRFSDVDDLPHCFECHDLVAGDVPELEQRAMDGDR